MQQHGQIRTEDDAKSVAFDIPAHDVFGLAPEVLAGGCDRSAWRMTVPSRSIVIPQHHACGSVAEQGGGDEHGHAVVLDPKTERAEIDAEKQDVRSGSRVRKLCGTGKSSNAAAATEAENRKALDIVAESKTIQCWRACHLVLFRGQGASRHEKKGARLTASRPPKGHGTERPKRRKRTRTRPLPRHSGPQ